MKPHIITKLVDQSETPPYSPQDIKLAYKLSKLDEKKNIKKFRPLVAIVDAFGWPTMGVDLPIFNEKFNLPPLDGKDGNGTLTQYVQEVGPGGNTNFQKGDLPVNYPSDPGWALEVALDIEWIHAIAPYADIAIVIAQSNNDPDMYAAIKFASELSKVVVVNMSFGEAEFRTERIYDKQSFSKNDVIFVSASGDDSAGTEYPSVSPNVLSTSGTTLVFKEDGKTQETVWSMTGGGISDYEPLPDYQNRPSVNGKYKTKYRISPDVSMVGDPSTGVSIYTSTPYESSVGWIQVGGTSVSTVLWSGIITLATQYRKKGFNNDKFFKKLYDLLDDKDKYGKNFRDITQGSNGVLAQVGYDAVSGLGTPICDKLIYTFKKF